MINLAEDLFSLYKMNNIEVSNNYKEAILNNLIKDLSFTSRIMEGLVTTLLNNKKIMAFNLMQNSIDKIKDVNILKIKPTIELIMKDELNHVYYTGEVVSKWLNENEKLYPIFIQCINHTNKETWQDVINMSQFMYNNINELAQSIE